MAEHLLAQFFSFATRRRGPGETRGLRVFPGETQATVGCFSRSLEELHQFNWPFFSATVSSIFKLFLHNSMFSKSFMTLDLR